MDIVSKQEKHKFLNRREFIIKGSLGTAFTVLGIRLWNLINQW